MREHLFKAKRMDNNEWVLGSLLCFKGCFIFDHNWYHFVYVKSKTVCECTGFEDMKGRKIFEGDLVTIPGYPNQKFVIVYQDGKYVMSQKGRVLSHLGCYASSVEVIGNIYDESDA